MKRAFAWVLLALVSFGVYRWANSWANPWSIDPRVHGIPSCADKGACT